MTQPEAELWANFYMVGKRNATCVCIHTLLQMSLRGFMAFVVLNITINRVSFAFIFYSFLIVSATELMVPFFRLFDFMTSY